MPPPVPHREEEARRDAGGPDARAVLDAAPDAMVGVDPSGIIRFANRRVEALFGYGPEELVGRSVEVLVPAGARATHRIHRQRYAQDPAARPMGGGLDLVARRRDGSVFPADISLSTVPTDDGPLVIAAVRDVTDRVLAAAALRAATERFRRAFEDAPIGMALVSLDGRAEQVNDALCRLLGEARESLLGWGSLLFGSPGLALPTDAQKQIVAAGAAVHREERRFVRGDGDVVWFLLTVSPLDDRSGAPPHFIVQVEDITAAKEAEARLVHQALHDPLTGLANRTLLRDHLGQALARSRRHGSHVGLLFLDIDHFKVVNDSLGHEAGDALLVAVADRLRGLLRQGDTAARFGGDEFVIICEDLRDEAEAVGIAGRVAAVLGRPLALEGREVSVAVSIGVVIVTEGAARPEDMLRDADAAMYLAKERGRARSEVFDDSVRRKVLVRLETEADLRRALGTGELGIEYQPQVRLPDEGLAGFEALVRWDHPTRGRIPPAEFLPLAEETGLIVPLGIGVLEGACREAARWAARFPGLVVSVNLSPRQLADPALPEEVARILTETGLPSSALCLEVTEAALVGAADTAVRSVAALRDQGVLFGIDDFGKGISSLEHLARFHPDRLKVDGDVVRGLGTDAAAEAIVSAFVVLAHGLGLVAVAEGIETREQRRALESLHCDLAQGYLFGRPRGVESADAVLAAAARGRPHRDRGAGGAG